MKGWIAIAFVTAAFCCASCRDRSTPPVEKTESIAPVADALSESTPSVAPTDEEDRFRELTVNRLSSRGGYRRPSAAEIERTEQLFAATLADDAELEAIRSAWNAEGFSLTTVENCEGSFWVLAEAPGQGFGRGIVAIRRSESVPVMFEAPHSFYDRYTDEITLGVYLRSRARVGYWNTAHRRVADLTKEDNSFLNAFTRAFARTFPQGRVVQFHGFSQKPEGHRFDVPIDLIVSQGTETPTQSFLKTASEIRRHCVPFKVAIFPLDVNALGGTLNRQRQVLENERFHDFIHCELSPLFRKRLREDADLQSRLGQALTHLERNPEIF